jgi:hypothetical protein
MNLEEVGDLFVVIVGFDNRHDPGQTTIAAWHAGLNEAITLAEATKAVIDHYAYSREFIMVADVNQLVRDMWEEQHHRDAAAGWQIARIIDYRGHIEKPELIGMVYREKGTDAAVAYARETLPAMRELEG